MKPFSTTAAGILRIRRGDGAGGHGEGVLHRGAPFCLEDHPVLPGGIGAVPGHGQGGGADPGLPLRGGGDPGAAVDLPEKLGVIVDDVE